MAFLDSRIPITKDIKAPIEIPGMKSKNKKKS
jgi:hypothetical protein